MRQEVKEWYVAIRVILGIYLAKIAGRLMGLKNWKFEGEQKEK